MLIISCIVFAIYASMKEGMIFGVVNKWWDKLTKNWDEDKADYWSKPLFSCPICMVFWHGSAAYFLIFNESWQDWIIVIIGAMGLNAIIVELMPDKN